MKKLTGNYYYCKTSRRLEFLRKKGFIPCKTQVDLKDPKYYVWVFEVTTGLEEALEEFERQIPVVK